MNNTHASLILFPAYIFLLYQMIHFLILRALPLTNFFKLLLFLKVDKDTSTNDCVIALASGLSGLAEISTFDSDEALQLQACLDAVRFS